MSDERTRLLSLLGASAAVWAGEDGVRIEPRRWLALSGAASVDYNVALCHAASDGEDIRRTIEDIAAGGMPAYLMLAGSAYADAQVLVEAGWVCVGALPFMVCEIGDADVQDSGARRLERDELTAARAVLAEAFGVGAELAAVAFPDGATSTEGQAIWGLENGNGTLASCLAAVRVEDCVAVWSMATAHAYRRQGNGARLLASVLADAAASGARCGVLYASPDGEQMYRSLGYAAREYCQIWSRPRWVLARS